MVGGPWGRHGVVGRARFFTPLRILLAFAILILLFAWVKERPCAYDPWVGHLQYTHQCYTDSIPLYGAEGLSEGVIPYFGIDPSIAPGQPGYSFGRVEYPVLSSAFMVGAMLFGQVLEVGTTASGVADFVLTGYQGYFVATCLLLGLCYLVTVWATAKTAGRRIWDASIVALSPLVIVHAFTNWDLFAVALLAVAMLMWARRRPVWAGVFLGLAIAAKLYPLLLLGALLVLALRTGRWRGFVQTLLATVLTWLAVNVPVMIGAYAGWSIFLDLNRSRPADWDTMWQLAERLWTQADQFSFVSAMSEGTINTLVFVSLAICCVGVAGLALAAPVRPRVAQLAFLIVLAFLLTGKVWSPQYSLWLLPLVALARPHWRLVIAWQLAEAFVWTTRLLWFVQRDLTVENAELTGQSKPLNLLTGLDYSWFATALVIRNALLIAIAVMIIREILNPSLDVVRRSGLDDPTGGVFENAPDRRRLTRVGFVRVDREAAYAGVGEVSDYGPDKRRDPDPWRDSDR